MSFVFQVGKEREGEIKIIRQKEAVEMQKNYISTGGK
jgi:hypothetical protein